MVQKQNVLMPSVRGLNSILLQTHSQKRCYGSAGANTGPGGGGTLENCSGVPELGTPLLFSQLPKNPIRFSYILDRELKNLGFPGTPWKPGGFYRHTPRNYPPNSAPAQG